MQRVCTGLYRELNFSESSQSPLHSGFSLAGFAKDCQVQDHRCWFCRTTKLGPRLQVVRGLHIRYPKSQESSSAES